MEQATTKQAHQAGANAREPLVCRNRRSHEPSASSCRVASGRACSSSSGPAGSGTCVPCLCQLGWGESPRKSTSRRPTYTGHAVTETICDNRDGQGWVTCCLPCFACPPFKHSQPQQTNAAATHSPSQTQRRSSPRVHLLQCRFHIPLLRRSCLQWTAAGLPSR